MIYFIGSKYYFLHIPEVVIIELGGKKYKIEEV